MFCLQSRMWGQRLGRGYGEGEADGVPRIAARPKARKGLLLWGVKRRTQWLGVRHEEESTRRRR